MRRIGKFYIDKQFFAVPPTPLVEFLSECTTKELKHIRTEYKDEYELVAEHPEFEEINDGEEVPEYRIAFERMEDGSVKRLPVEKIYGKKPIFGCDAFHHN